MRDGDTLVQSASSNLQNGENIEHSHKIQGSNGTYQTFKAQPGTSISGLRPEEPGTTIYPRSDAGGTGLE